MSNQTEKEYVKEIIAKQLRLHINDMQIKLDNTFQIFVLIGERKKIIDMYIDKYQKDLTSEQKAQKSCP
jgi:hypothetical protein